jgi:hypothetical protein
MSLAAKPFDFNVGSGLTGTTVVVPHGLGQVPKAILLMMSGNAGAGTGGNLNDHRRGIGWAIGSGAAQQYAFANRADNASVAPAESCRCRGEKGVCLLEISNGGLVVSSLQVQSWDATNITFLISDNFSTNQRVIGWALGGSDITDIATGDFVIDTSGTAPFTQDVTGLGFTGTNGRTMLLLAGVNETAFAAVGTDSSLMMGAACSPTQRAVAFTFGDHNANPTGGYSYTRNDQLVALSAPAAAGLLEFVADFNGFIAGGFQLNVTRRAGANAYRLAYLAIGGPSWSVKSANVPTTATTVAVTGAGFTPVGGFIFSSRTGLSTVNTLSGAGESSFAFGCFDATGGRAASGEELGLVATSSTSCGVATDACYQATNPVNGGVSAKMALQSLDVGGATFLASNPEDVGYQFHTLLVGPPPGGGGTTVVVIDEGVQVGLSVPLNMLGWDVEAPLTTEGMQLGVLLGIPTLTINNGSGSETPPPSDPGFTAGAVIEAARDRHSSFDRIRHPDALLVRFLDRTQRELLLEALQVSRYTLSTTTEIPFPLASFAGGVNLPSALSVIGGETELIDGALLPFSLVPWGQRNESVPFYGGYIAGDKLFFKGEATDWTGVVKVILRYVPDIARLVTLGSILGLPRTIEPALVEACAAFMAGRSHTDPQLPAIDESAFIQRAEKARAKWLEALAAQQRSQIRTIREVW